VTSVTASDTTTAPEVLTPINNPAGVSPRPGSVQLGAGQLGPARHGQYLARREPTPRRANHPRRERIGPVMQLADRSGQAFRPTRIARPYASRRRLISLGSVVLPHRGQQLVLATRSGGLLRTDRPEIGWRSGASRAGWPRRPARPAAGSWYGRPPRGISHRSCRPWSGWPGANQMSGGCVQRGVAPVEGRLRVSKPRGGRVTRRRGRPPGEHSQSVVDLLAGVTPVGARIAWLNGRAQAPGVVIQANRSPRRPSQLGQHLYRKLVHWHDMIIRIRLT
jgi:hypothetical protein